MKIFMFVGLQSYKIGCQCLTATFWTHDCKNLKTHDSCCQRETGQNRNLRRELFRPAFLLSVYLSASSYVCYLCSMKKNIKKEGRAFNHGLTQNGQTKYLFTVVNSKVLCLVCRNVVSVRKEISLRRHFETQHPNLAESDANENRLERAFHSGRKKFLLGFLSKKFNRSEG